MAVPTEGYAVYEEARPTDPVNANARLDVIAASGVFKMVINYSLLLGHMTDIIAYINHAASVGLKVAIPLEDAAIWKNNAIAATYPTLSGDAGSTTDSGFTTYVVNQTKGLAGTWGYYIGDEVANSDHAALKAHTDIIHAADSTKPRLMIADGLATNSVASGTNIFTDCCEVLGDDFYPIGGGPGYVTTVAQEAAAIQAFINTTSLQSAIALQTFSWAAYGVVGQPWPTEAQMQQASNDAIANMNPRLIIWYSFFAAYQTGSPQFAPPLQLANVVSATEGKSGVAMFPPLKRRGLRR